nr:DUF3459 domain-containing protein [Phytoactinopolyspora mesophila]
MLEVYRAALRLRRQHEAFQSAEMTWADRGADVLAFSREPGFACVVNLSAEPVTLPEHRDVLLASGPLTDDGRLPADTTAWLAV